MMYHHIKSRWHKGKRRASNIISGAGFLLLPPLLTVGNSILILHYTSLSTWGMVVECMLVMGLFSVVVTWGTRDYLMRKTAQYSTPHVVAKNWLKHTFSRFLLVLPPCIVLQSAIINQFHTHNIPQILLTAAWLFAMCLFRSFDFWIMRQQAYSRIFIFDLGVGAGLILCLYGFAWYNNLGYINILAVYCAAEFLRVGARIYMFWPACKQAKHLLRVIVRKPAIIAGASTELRRSYGFMLIGLAGVLASKGDSYLISYYLPHQDLGTYQILSSLIIYVQTAGASLMISQMRLLLRSPRHVVYRVACKHALLGATMMAGLALAIPFAVPRIYGINIPFSLVVLACVAGVMPFFYGPLILQVQKQTEKMVAYIILIAATCTYLSGAILIPQLQIYGAPLALSVGHIITALLVFCLEKKYHARST